MSAQQDEQRPFSQQVMLAYAELTGHQARPDGRGWKCNKCDFKSQPEDHEGFALHQLEAIMPLLQAEAGERTKTFPARIRAVRVDGPEDRVTIELVAHEDIGLLNELILRRPVRVALTGYRHSEHRGDSGKEGK